MTTLASGSRLGVYEIRELLGAGGMGEVYRAYDTKLDRQVAIKILAPVLAADSAALARFEREAQAVAALSHPNILAIHDFRRDGANVYAVMEFLEGETLRMRLAEGALPVRKAIDVGKQIAQGLAAAHSRGTIHRDLKPDNIFLSANGHAKILDFGLAKAMNPDPNSSETIAIGKDDTTPGTVVGTVGYMSPEQIKGAPVDARTDIFAFGAVAYEMVSGRRAFARPSTAETMAAILKEDAPEWFEEFANRRSSITLSDHQRRLEIRRCGSRRAPVVNLRSSKRATLFTRTTGTRWWPCITVVRTNPRFISRGSHNSRVASLTWSTAACALVSAKVVNAAEAVSTKPAKRAKSHLQHIQQHLAALTIEISADADPSRHYGGLIVEKTVIQHFPSAKRVAEAPE